MNPRWRMILSTPTCQVEANDLERYALRTNAWYGEEGPRDGFLWLSIPSRSDPGGFTAFLRTLTEGNVVDLTYERGTSNAAVIRCSALVESVEGGRIRLRLPEQGAAFGPRGCLRDQRHACWRD